MDGWGIAPDSATNAVSAAHTPVYDKLLETCAHARLEASGPAVGLPEGQPGNSEVGHMNIGAGRCVLQDLPRIHNAIADNSLASIAALRAFIDKLKVSGGRVHLLGLFSVGGVHAHSAHSAALAGLFHRLVLRLFCTRLQMAETHCQNQPIVNGKDSKSWMCLSHWAP